MAQLSRIFSAGRGPAPPTDEAPAEQPSPIESLDVSSDEEEEDSRHGWVIVGCVFAINTVTWGTRNPQAITNSTTLTLNRHEHYISYYIAHNYFEGATYLRYAFVGGLSVAFAWFAAPFVNYLTKTFGIRVPMAAGVVAVCLGQCLAGISRKFGAFLFFQGLLFGLGLGLTQVPSQPVLPLWFDRRLSLAQGIATCGSGFGGLIFANTTRAALESIGVRYTLLLNGCISAIVLVPSIAFLKDKGKKVEAKTEPLQLHWLWHKNFFWVWTWGAFGVMGYFIALYSNASYATDGLGLSQQQGAALQSILAAGQVLGRPLVGQALDMAGRLNMAIAANILAALSCLVIWLPARSFAVLAVFSIMQGGFGGTILCVIAPVATSAVGVIDVGSALAMFWLMMVLPATFAQPAAVALIDYSRHTLKREGPEVYQASIILCGALFALSAAMLCGGKFAIQGNFKILKKT
ncbi:hypothetical protein CEP54_002740 [Fusarium duplospermum]|uniref:Major facilitator superfamily transporter n=1 Tax=Fusarium duplospermum TaxID=1325734 RepID=A0A428QTW3_9HYPO|nr:hypothetical protein CEP54_002740 [Fusarium duplospermum]